MAHSMEKWVGKVAVVTGASSGIGAAIAERLVKEGLVVAALARRKHLLDQLACKLTKEKGKIYTMKTDVTKEEEILSAFGWIQQNLGPIHILVNNAGVAAFGQDLLTGNTKDWENIIKVNVLGLCIATREAAKDMRKNKIDGHIIHINSIAGHKVFKFPGLNMYWASKFAVTALADVLRQELDDLKLRIKITNLSPGITDTEIFPDAVKAQPIFSEAVKENRVLASADIAESVVYVLSTPPHVQIQELTIRSINDGF